MSDETKTDTNTESTDTQQLDEALITEARDMGWKPKEEFQGDPERWVDAATYVDKGRHVMPILNQNNERLRGEVRQRDAKIQDLEGKLRKVGESVEALEEFYTEDVKRRVEQERARIKDELKQAKRDGNIEAEVDLTDELAQLDTQIPAASKEDKQPRRRAADKRPGNGTTQDMDVPEDFKQWARENPWYGKDVMRTDLAFGTAQRLRATLPPEVQGRPFMDKVAQEVEQTMRRLGVRTQGKVEGSKGSPNRQAGGKTFADLPDDAKTAARSPYYTERLVGPDRLHKDQASWEAAYAKKYYEENPQ